MATEEFNNLPPELENELNKEVQEVGYSRFCEFAFDGDATEKLKSVLYAEAKHPEKLLISVYEFEGNLIEVVTSFETDNETAESFATQMCTAEDLARYKCD
ncbi:hypothetical protein [Pseudoalteromonas ruthenica]|uniref:hypothetical protein n=1 Tax=Pseudoalteromonas ruthenica TaxID=151081 RepID=UPI00110A5D37|nr:hypothetical protein [Pseudoalteromonas ruthenica]TMO87679.1 hypothetical protein CWC12_10395 [Pseudoalteromonas ruthenica]TMP20850.1 hypothetical protein CWC06_19515 [Pseudoalteromonas ruthenica]